MTTIATHIADRKQRGGKMEFLIPLALLAFWIILQVWILPRLGVKT